MISAENRNRTVTRRRFLGLAWISSLLGLFGQASFSMYRFFKPRYEPGAFGTKIVAGRIDEFVPGTVSHIQQGRFYITRLEDGGLLALWQRCTHLGCTVPWREDEALFHCPCHSSIFDSQGEVISGPAPRPMDLFPIEIIDSEVLVNTGSPIERSAFDPSQLTYG